ncbi:MAG: D-2-hydroxyacid dehydrogenase [Bacteroidales bacterium]|nr:D-2-hydroxyacid dehydrogenase [Bacteroidales bacterium]
MNIVVLDGYTLNPGDLTWDGLAEFGNLIVYDRTDFEVNSIIKNIGSADIVFTNKTPLSGEVLPKVPSVRYIGVLATGYDVVDLESARESGILVTNIPTYGTVAVAQFTFALILELCHHVGAHNDAVHTGVWSKSPDFCYWKCPLIELDGKTIGLIGFGRIGQATAKIAQSFGLKVLVYDIYQDPELENENCRYVSLDVLLNRSDFISLHCPLSESTWEIINRNSISAMKDGVMIINTARGQLINENDLSYALNTGKIGAAAIDVVSEEPIKDDNPLLSAKNCIITPHIAWAPKESRSRLMNTAIANLKAYLKGEPINVVS